MDEGLENVLRTGYATWRKNLNIALPFLFNLIAGVLLLIVFAVLSLLIIGIPLTLNLYELTAPPSDSARFLDPASLAISLLLIFIIGVVLFFIYLLIDSYFTAGAIGMAKTALEMGKTSLGDMFSYGGKKFLSMFFANLILFVFIIAMGIFLAIIQAITNAPLIEAFIAITSIIFALFPFAIVISDLGAIDGLKRSYDLFMKNKLLFFLIFIFVRYIIQFIYLGVFVLGMVLLSAGILSLPITTSPSLAEVALMSSGVILLLFFWFLATILISSIVGIFVSSLTTVWWSGFYMGLTQNDRKD
jgi:hypothetical protein